MKALYYISEPLNGICVFKYVSEHYTNLYLSLSGIREGILSINFGLIRIAELQLEFEVWQIDGLTNGRICIFTSCPVRPVDMIF